MKIPYQEIIEYLNQATGKRYKAGIPRTQKFIKARFREGFTLEEFKTVIDTKVDDWGSDPDMNQYLRPETLFGSKFEAYLNQSDSLNDRSGILD